MVRRDKYYVVTLLRATRIEFQLNFKQLFKFLMTINRIFDNNFKIIIDQ